MIIKIAGTDTVISINVRSADSFTSRIRGLLFSKQLGNDEAILISRCNQVHTHFMKYAIDVVFLDKDFIVKHVVRDMRPWTISKYVFGACYALELNTGCSSLIKINDSLSVL